MISRVTFFPGLLLLGFLGLSGCFPAPHSQFDEEKESHFLAGKSRVSTMDFKGAIEAFEKALEVNPHSAAAHFELGCLFDKREMDPSAAIYHYEQYLKLRSDAGNSEVVRQRINACKQELAKNVSLGPLSERQQREMEALAQENKNLAEQVKRLTEDIEKWRVFAARLQAFTNSASRSGPITSPGPSAGTYADSTTPSGPGPGFGRTHIVKTGETLTVIARKYNVRVDALSAANPSVDSRRLKVGQVLQVPNS